MSQATIPDLPLNTTPPGTSLFEISNSGVSESTRLQDIVFGLQETSQKDQPNGYAGLDGSGLIDPAQLPDISGTYQVISEKDLANGYAGLDATGLVSLGAIPQLPQSRIIDLVSDLALRELLANKVITIGTPGNDTNYPTEKATRDALDLKQDTLLFTPEDIANKVITVGTPGNDTNYPSEKAVRDALDLKEDSLGFTPENIANKVTTVGTPGDDTNYPTEQAVREALDLKEDSLGFTPEDVANKSTDLLTPDNTKYATTLAITTELTGYQLLTGKGAANGYAGLDAGSELLLANFPSGAALQFLRRNAANNALEFAASGTTSPLTTKGDVYTYDTGDARLPVGTDGFILSANSVEATGLEWIVAPVTSPLTTKGDLYTFDTVNQRLPVGANDQVLVADSVEATGIKWAALAAIVSLNADIAAAQTLTGGDGITITDLTPDHSFAVDATVARDTDNLGFFAATTSAQLLGVMSDETGTGLLVFGTSPTIVTPTIASFVNSTHDHSNAAGGGQLTNTALIAGVFSAITGLGTQTQTLNMGNQLISAVLAPVGGTDAANKTYVDNLVNGLAWKDSAVVATTGNISLTGEQIIDTVLTSTSRVLVKDQTLGEDNGVYVTAAGAWARSTDADSDVELVNMSIFIEQGTVNIGTAWTQTTDLPITVGTTVLSYAQIGAGPSNPLTTKGDIFGYDTAGARIPVGSDSQVLVANSAEALGVEWQNFPQPLTTKGDLFTFSTVVARLPVGITGQILSANAAETTGLEWINNDPSPLTSKGDIYTFTTVNERIAVGTNGQYLTANSAQPTGLEWITLPAFGDVDGPVSSTNNAIARFDETTGKIIQNSGVIINDTNTVTVPGPIVLTAAGTVPAGTETYLREVSSDLIVNVTALASLLLNFGTATNYEFTQDEADFNSNNLINAILPGTSTLNATAVSASLVYANGVKQLFNANATNAGLNVGSFTADPGGVANGDIYYNSTSDQLFGRIGAAWVDLGQSGGGAVNSISQLDSSVTVTDTGVDGLVDFVIDGNSVLQVDDVSTQMNQRFEFAQGTNATFASSVVTLPNDGNFFKMTNTTGNFFGINTTGWQPGSVVYLQFASSNNVQIYDNATVTPPIANFQLLEPASPFQIGSSLQYKVIPFLYDGTSWIQQQLISNPGDVLGPVAAASDELVLYSGTSGKIIKRQSQSANNVKIAAGGNMAMGRSITWGRDGSGNQTALSSINDNGSNFRINVNSLTPNLAFTFNSTTPQYTFTAGTADFTNASLINTIINASNNTLSNIDETMQIVGVGAAGTVLTSNGVGVAPTYQALPPGGGDVVGPAGATDHAVVRFDTATGKLIQNSGATLGDLDELVGVSVLSLVTGATIPLATLNYIFPDTGGMTLNTPTGDTFDFTIAATSEYEMSATAFTFKNGNNLVINSDGSLSGYIDIDELTGKPALPATDHGRLYTKDVSTATHLFFLNSSDEEIDLSISGDVTGPASSTDNEFAVFSGATGKVIKSQAIDATLSNAGEPTWPRANLFTNYQGGLPSPGVSYIQNYFSDMRINVSTANEVQFTIQGATEYIFNATSYTMNNKNIIIGGAYYQFDSISSPASTGFATRARLFLDLDNSNHLTIQRNGVEVDLEAVGGQTPWISDIEAARFDLNNLGNLNFALTGAIALPAITEPYITYDDELATDAMRFNIPSGDEYAYYINGVEQMSFSGTILDGSGAGGTPALLQNFSSLQMAAVSNMEVRFGATTSTVGTLIGTMNWRADQSDAGLIDYCRIEGETATTTDATASGRMDLMCLEGGDAAPIAYITLRGQLEEIQVSKVITMAGQPIRTIGALEMSTGGLTPANTIAYIKKTATDFLFNVPNAHEIHFTFNGGTPDYEFTQNVFDIKGNNLRGVVTIDDNNGLQLIRMTQVVSAVNELNVSNAITATNPILGVSGNDANIGLDLVTKGSGTINFLDDVVTTGDILMGDRFQGKQGPAVASASSIILGDGNYFDITGTTTINHMRFLGWQAGSIVTLQFDASVTVTHNAGTNPANTVSFFLAGAVDFSATADDTLTLVYDGTVWREVCRSVN